MKPEKTNLSLSLLIIISGGLWILSCTHKADLTGLPEVCFDRDVKPIYSNSCAIPGCHDGKSDAGRALDNYTNIRNTVVPGDPGASSSYKAITSTWGENRMPPGQPLSLENRTMIRVWIEQGANESKCLILKTHNDNLKSEQPVR